jgi:sec-independent protein translocase protein TatA
MVLSYIFLLKAVIHAGNYYKEVKMFGLGPMELVLIFLVILLVFGAKRIPEIAHGIGKGITEFKKAARDVTDEFDTNAPAATSNPPVRNELKGQRISEKPQQAAPQQSAQQQSAPQQTAPQQTAEQVKSPEKKEG